ncbi:MAG: lipid A biosynthesis acyltransferase [Gammaproteobacteria bacterium]|nr:lipid A biosynthesis acyltransferase [Gammaproteobacteria bacterium]
MSPLYWPTWFGISLVWLLSRLPFEWQLKVGGGLGSALYFILPERRRVCHTNLRLAFPDLPEKNLASLARDVYRNIGYSIAEVATLWFQPLSRIAHRFELVGREHLDQALATGHGVILLQAHFSTLEFCGSWIATQIPGAAALVDEPKNPLYAALLRDRRERYVDEIIDNRDIRKMIRHLKAGGLVWYSPDQSVRKRDGGIASTFFNQTVLTTPGTSRMARMTGAKILPYLPVRSKQPGKYKLHIFPLLENFPGASPEADTETINRLFETHIRQYPEQYFWVHKRFKPASKDLPNPYQ